MSPETLSSRGASFEETLRLIRQIRPRLAFLTHIEGLWARSYNDYLKLEQNTMTIICGSPRMVSELLSDRVGRRTNDGSEDSEDLAKNQGQNISQPKR